MKLFVFIGFVIFSPLYVQVGAEFTAAVVEFYPEQDKTLPPEERLRRNVDEYLKILEKLEGNKPDIVVYPEMTLSTNSLVTQAEEIIPFSVEVEPSDKSLCTDAQNPTFFRRLACAALRSNTYLVVNLYEKARCDDVAGCSTPGWDFYNTNVVFDRNGAVVSRYRKYNLFGEAFVKQTATADISVFETDFGARFASFVCFDILFKEPALDLVRKHKVTNIIFPSMWFSELPFLTALQAQHQWAYATNATLLASGANDPKRGSGGSGVYEGVQGALIIDVLGSTDSKAFISQVPGKQPVLPDSVEEIDRKARQMDGFYFKVDYLSPYTSKIIRAGNQNVQDTVCHKQFCCHFDVQSTWSDTQSPYYTYHMVAYDGVRSFSGVYNGGIEICGIVACKNSTLDSCGKRFSRYDDVSWPVTFERIQIKASFGVDEKKFQYPNSLLSHMKPLTADAIEWSSTTSGSYIERTYTLKQPQNRLMTFAIYGRDFNRDSPPTTLRKSQLV